MVYYRIKDPKKPGDYLVISQRDFDPAVHELWSEAGPALAPTDLAPPIATGNVIDPGPVRRRYFGSAAAAKEGSRGHHHHHARRQ
jgi:hypothetical protein